MCKDGRVSDYFAPSLANIQLDVYTVKLIYTLVIVNKSSVFLN